jgi:3-hydroxyisobutyrate dehydrogenase
VRYGFVGLGHLGRHLARSLARAGFATTVCDLDRTKAKPLLAAGAAWAATPAELAARVDALVTCMPSPKATSAVLDEVLPVLARGATWIEMSTNGPDEVRTFANRAAEHGVAMLEAPVTGGVHRAATGEITVLVGGDGALFRAHRAALRAMGGEIIHMGPLGSAATIKVITNMLAFVHLVASGEAMMLAKRAGLDLAKAYAAIRASSGNSFVHETETQLVLSGSYDVGFTMDLACKDLGFALGMGRDLGVPLELAGLVERTFARARQELGGSTWSTAVVRLLEDALGEELRADGFPAALGPG